MSADFGSGTGYITVSNSLYGITGSAPTISASASAIFEDDEVPGGTGQEEYIVSGTVSYCAAGSNSNTNGSDMVVIDLLEDGTRRPGWGNGSGVALFNTCSGGTVGASFDSSYAVVATADSASPHTPYVTLVGASGGNVLTERFIHSTGLRDTVAYGPLDGPGPLRKGFTLGPTGAAYAATLDTSLNKIVASGTGGSNDFLAVRFEEDGTLDGTFGQGGSIKIDFGSTSGIVTDGGRAVASRTFDGGTTFDILVGGYTFGAGTGKYKIALVDLLDDNMFHVT